MRTAHDELAIVGFAGVDSTALVGVAFICQFFGGVCARENHVQFRVSYAMPCVFLGALTRENHVQL